jgi:hypothetical protein
MTFEFKLPASLTSYGPSSKIGLAPIVTVEAGGFDVPVTSSQSWFSEAGTL